MIEKTHCFINNIDVTVIDGKCTTPCSIEDCLLVDMSRIDDTTTTQGPKASGQEMKRKQENTEFESDIKTHE